MENIQSETNQESAVYRFMHVDPIEHRPALQRLALRSNIDLPYLQALDTAIYLGSRKLHHSRSTLNEMRKTHYWRRKTISLLGLDDPHHELHEAWKKSGIGYEIVSSKLYNTILTLDRLSNEEAIEIIQKAHFLLQKDGRDITMRFQYMGRVATFLGWQGDIKDLTVEHPLVLLTPMPTLRLLARIAVCHGTPELRTMSPERLAQAIEHRPRSHIERHLLAIIQKSINYCFGMKSASLGQQNYVRPTKGMVRQYLLDNIKNNSYIHPAVLKTYFGQFPASDSEIQEFPHIIKFTHFAEKPKIRYVTGQEKWLSLIKPNFQELSYRYRSEFLRNLNNAIEAGTISMRKTSETAAYESGINGRNQFYKIIGWSNPSHRFFKKFQKVHSQLSLLPPNPLNVIETFNLLDKYGLDIELTLDSYFGIFQLRSKNIERKFRIIIEEGFNPADIKASLLKCGETALIAKLQAMRIRQSSG